MQATHAFFLFLFTHAHAFSPPLQTATPTPLTPPPSPATTAPPHLHPRQLQRRKEDTGFDDPEQCNLGVCSTGSYCSVYSPGKSGAREDPAIGSCCPMTERCTAFTECLPYSEHSLYRYNTETNMKLYCGRNNPICATQEVEYGYKLGWLRKMWCRASSLEETFSLNKSWEMYEEMSILSRLATMTSGTTTTDEEEDPKTNTENPIKIQIQSDSDDAETPTPALSTQFGVVTTLILTNPTQPPDSTTTPTPDSDSAAATAVPTSTALSTGALAGIIVGAVIAGALIAAGVVWCMLRRRVLKAGMNDPPLKGGGAQAQLYPDASGKWEFAAPWGTSNTMSEIDSTVLVEMQAPVQMSGKGHYSPG